MESNGDGFARPLTLEEIEGGQRDILERDRERIEAITRRIPAPENHEYALSLQGVTELHFGSRTFRIPPVPFPAGVRLQHVQQRLGKIKGSDEADADVMRDLLGVLEEAVDVFWSLIEPVSLWDRLVWRWRANPFLECTENEIGELLGLFCACRMRSRIRPQTPAASAIPPYRMSRKNAPSLPTSVPRGSGRTATP